MTIAARLRVFVFKVGERLVRWSTRYAGDRVKVLICIGDREYGLKFYLGDDVASNRRALRQLFRATEDALRRSNLLSRPE
jgi:hypothetical protein